ncbi:iron ABC transporter permease [Nocardioides dubius]|uniref:ABC transporter permease n=1 Tax=Nocardioides dubius TaxID=317019 RepID=UPI0031CF3283
MRRRLVGEGRWAWSALAVLIGVLVAAPILAVVVDGLVNAGSAELPDDVGAMTLTSIWLLLGVGIGTSVLGIGLAWLTTAFDFPLRRLLSWALVLPLAMPAYILGFVFLSTFDVAGPVQTALRDWFGDDVWVPQVRSLGGAVVVMSLTLYPYVYLMARAAFTEQSARTFDAARSLGAGRARTFWQVLLPLARPSLAAGLALVMMETLTDFATVQYFNVQTVSVGVYLVWKGSYDLHSATQLAALVLLFAVAVLAGERMLRGGARFHQRGGSGEGVARVPLHGVRGWLACLAGLVVLGAAFVLPVLRLATWAWAGRDGSGTDPLDARFGDYIANSVSLALVVAVICVLLAVVIGHAQRLGGGALVRAAGQATTFGYAVPGAVVGIGVLIVMAWSDDALVALGVEGGTGLLITGSVIGILIAQVVRFVAPAHQAVDASYAKIAPSITGSALSLGAGPTRVLARVHLPQLRSGVTVAAVLVLVDVIKELPLVLLLRPFGFTTVSVWVYQLARENFWEKAALPALLIVVLALVPVFVLIRGREVRGRNLP